VETCCRLLYTGDSFDGEILKDIIFQIIKKKTEEIGLLLTM